MVGMDTFSEFYIPGILFLCTLLFGFWLSHAGKPYNGVLFNAHKLIALGAVVMTILQLMDVQAVARAPVHIIALLITAAGCIVALFTSGALMSMNKLDYASTLSIHRIMPVVLAVVILLAIQWLVTQG